MRNIDSAKESFDKIENVKQVDIQKQNFLIGKFKPKKNHTLFEINPKERTILKAVFDEAPAIKFEDAMKGLKSASKKITKKPDCIYVSALNQQNALKILKRDYGILLFDNAS